MKMFQNKTKAEDFFLSFCFSSIAQGLAEIVRIQLSVGTSTIEAVETIARPAIGAIEERSQIDSIGAYRRTAAATG
jgi:hypothetical protein